MKAAVIISRILEREHITSQDVARAMGKSPRYLNPILYGHRSPQIDTYAGIVDSMGYDLIVRSRDDGFEFQVEPPE